MISPTHGANITYFVSPHGLGHASRAVAVMNALHARSQARHFEIFTRVPRWFFQDSLTAPFTYHSVLTDVGLAQETSLREDIPQTLRHLHAFLPFDRAVVSRLAQRVKQAKCQLIVCDIAPLGIAVARAADLPSVLIENFTWDWIYAGYVREEARFDGHIAYLRGVFRLADYHIQAEPVCAYRAADLVTPPVSREPRTSKKQIRRQLDIPRRAKAVLITMGGIPARHAFIDRLAEARHVRFIVPGASRTLRAQANSILLPHRSRFYHPDLMHACDAVIGKAGYSTVAEAYRAGIPFGFVPRAKFRESEIMAAFIRTQMNGIEIPAARFDDGRWLDVLPDLLAAPRVQRRAPNGAEPIADFIAELLD